LPQQALLDAKHIGRKKTQLGSHVIAAFRPGIFPIAGVVEADVVGEDSQVFLSAGEGRESEEQTKEH